MDADAHNELGSRFGVTGFPTLKWFASGSTEPTAYEGGRSADDLVKFVNEKTGYSVKIKKAPSAVHELTAENFDAIVKDESADVLVEFYAPWCGHCKSLAPHYAKAANAFKTEKGCRIAALDADSHRDTAQAYGVSGYPTLKFFPKGDKSGSIAYEGGRTAEDIVNYMNEKCGTARALSGAYLPSAGRTEALDALAKRFVAATAAEREQIQAEAAALAGSYDGPYPTAASFYAAAMKKIAAKADYAQTETARLTRMIDGGALAAEKVDEFWLRINVLAAFE